MTPTIEELVAEIVIQFPTFGGGKGSEWNPIAQALKDKPPVFAAGTDVKEVVTYIVRRLK